jgi:D-alanyl-D-alanine dipeptidase
VRKLLSVPVDRASHRSRNLRHILSGASALATIALFISPLVLAQNSSSLASGAKPAPAPVEWHGIIGEYGSPGHTVSILENSGQLKLLMPPASAIALTHVTDDTFTTTTPDNPVIVSFLHFQAGFANQLRLAGDPLPRLKEGPAEGQVFRLTPTRPVEELRKEALAASPPQENGTFRKPELVELAPLDPAIHLDIRYATANDFLGVPVYTQARAFLQRPAADALLRVLRKLKPLGYGLLIHDAYRPWYVTKIFWDATPQEGKIFVADPAEGSRHNRGCAIDLTLYDLSTGEAVEMPGTYDEMSPRSFPDYPGGTSLQRWHRDLLRRAMESEGFTVYEHEWWHFDYKDWRDYPILNIPFEDLHPGHGLAGSH